MKNVKSDSSPIHWQYGAIARLPKGAPIEPLLYGGYSSISLGYIGLYEVTKLMTGVSHTQPGGTEFALKVMNRLRKACDDWKAQTNIGFALYGTPAESLCYRFARIDKERFGTIPDVTDKGYYTNSYHVDVREHIVARYNSEIRGFYNYYSIANNVSYAASKFGYIMEYSMYHTIAAKTNSSISKVIDKYKKGNDIIVPYHDAKGKLRYRVFYNEGFKRKLPSSFADVDNIPYIITVPQPTLVERLKSEVCELCGKVGPVVMHHARNLNHLKGDTEWEKLMLAKHRKTLVVCTSCNAKIQSHAG